MTVLKYDWRFANLIGQPEDWNKVDDNYENISTWANGNIDNSNLSGTAGITDANLASPSNAVYRTILTGSGRQGSGEVVSNRVFVESGGALIPVPDGTYSNAPLAIYLASSDHAVAGKTTKLRLRAQAFTNGTAPGQTLTVGVHAVTAVGGGATSNTVTLGAALSGSTVAFASPALNLRSQGNSGDFTFPADGYYAIGLVGPAGAGIAANSSVALLAQLQVRNV